MTVKPLYRLSYWLLHVFFTVCYRYKIEGAENIPAEGTYIVAANHVSYLDPPLVGICFGKQVFFMAKSELFKVPLLGQFLRGIGSFPVTRETADMKAIKHALALLKEGKILGIFPEGSRSRSGTVEEGELGVALLAKKGQVPIVPCAVQGTYRSVKMKGILPQFSRIRVIIGKPIYLNEAQEGLSRKECMKRFTVEVMGQLKQLLKESEK